MRTLMVAAAVFFFGTRALFGAFSSQDAGRSASQFLKLGAGARAAGMGEAFTGVADDATAVYWNPAGLNRVRGIAASAMHAVWFEGITYDWLSFAREQENGEVWGAGIQYLSYGSLTETDDIGRERGAFAPSDLALSLSYAGVLSKVMLGGSIKYISSKIKNTAHAVAVDAGVMYSFPRRQNDGYAGRRTGGRAVAQDAEGPRPGRAFYRMEEGSTGFLPQEKLVVGFVAQNLGTEINFAGEDSALPLSFKLGAACLILPGWLAAFDVTAPVDNETVSSLGTEYGVPVSKNMSVAGRAGYTTRAKETGGLNGISAGFGVSYLNYTVDYAFVPYGDLGNTHRISFSLKL
ncbi:MAG: PorV/PorQ family protein [Endomicrobiales bacterium]